MTQWGVRGSFEADVTRWGVRAVGHSSRTVAVFGTGTVNCVLECDALGSFGCHSWSLRPPVVEDVVFLAGLVAVGESC